MLFGESGVRSSSTYFPIPSQGQGEHVDKDQPAIEGHCRVSLLSFPLRDLGRKPRSVWIASKRLLYRLRTLHTGFAIRSTNGNSLYVGQNLPETPYVPSIMVVAGISMLVYAIGYLSVGAHEAERATFPASH